MKFSLPATLFLIALWPAIPAWGDAGLFDPNRVMVENASLSDAEEMLRQWLSGHPEDQEARFLLARVLAWQKRDGEAHAQYDLLLEQDPGNRDYLMGKSLLSAESSQDMPK